jgi:hypothetical protein
MRYGISSDMLPEPHFDDANNAYLVKTAEGGQK